MRTAENKVIIFINNTHKYTITKRYKGTASFREAEYVLTEIENGKQYIFSKENFVSLPIYKEITNV